MIFFSVAKCRWKQNQLLLQSTNVKMNNAMSCQTKVCLGKSILKTNNNTFCFAFSYRMNKPSLSLSLVISLS